MKRRNPYPSFNIGKRFNLERRLKRSVIKKAIHNLSKMINSRRQILIWYRQFLTDPFESEYVFSYETVYKRGPVYMAELARLLDIRRDLWLYYSTI